MELLQVLGDRVIVPGPVAEEVAAHSDEAARALEKHAWLERSSAEPVVAEVAAWDLGAGESAVIAWAVTHPGSIAVIDDYAARTCAAVLGVSVVGTLARALRAKISGRIPVARPLVDDFRRAGLYLSDLLIREALAIVGE